jgi:hypothetical protein
MAMSNLPSIRLVSWNLESGVGVTVTAMPLRSKSPFSCATQIGQLKPPGKTITEIGLSGWVTAGAGAIIEPARHIEKQSNHGLPDILNICISCTFCGVKLSFWTAVIAPNCQVGGTGVGAELRTVQPEDFPTRARTEDRNSSGPARSRGAKLCRPRASRPS